MTTSEEVTSTDPTRATRPVEFEYELRDLLRGCRLVGELDLEGELFETAKAIAESSRTVDALAKLAYRSPATLAVYLVGSGAQSYDEDGYWAHVPLASTPPRQAQIGQAFERALGTLQLEDFAWLVAQQGARYVTPILLHGTVPRRDVIPLAKALCAELDEGAVDIADVLAIWRKGSTRFEGLNRPTKRFIQHGGAVAVDLLGRIWDAVVARRRGLAETAGIPRYIAAEIEHMDLSWVPTHRIGAPLAQPSLVFDPWSGRGPELLLPATTQVGQWLVTVNEVQERFTANPLREIQLDVPPGRSWRVEGEWDGRIVVRRVFQGVSGLPVYLFDPTSGELRRDQSQVDDRMMIVVLPDTARLLDGDSGAELLLVDEFPPLFGEWSGFRAVEVDFRDVASVVAEVGDATAPIGITGEAKRVTLIGSAVAGVTDGHGREVYDGLPSLRLPANATVANWTVRLEMTSEVIQRACSELSPVLGDTRTLRLDGLLPAPAAGLVSLRVRGPLGSDLADEFTVVERLRFDRPRLPVGPSDVAAPEVWVDPRLAIVEAEGGKLLFRSGVQHRQCTVTGAGAPLALRFAIPRVLWSIWRQADPVHENQSDVLILEPREFDDPSLQLGVSTGVGCELTVVLVDASGEQMQSIGRERTSDTHGRRTFGLHKAADTVRHVDADVLTIQLLAGGIAVDAVKIHRRLRITDLVAEVVVDDESCNLDLAWQEEGPNHPRRALLWPEERPWEDPIDVPLAARPAPSTRLILNNRIPGGGYLVQVTADSEVERPGAVGDDVVRVVIPPRAESAPPSFGDDEVGCALAGSLPCSRVDEAELAGSQERELAVLVGAVLQPPSPEIDAVRSRAVQLLFHDSRDSAVAAEHLVEATHARRLGAEARVRLGIEVVRTAVDCPSTSLTPRQRSDLWETNRVLAAALDRPEIGREGERRWLEQTGWTPEHGMPYVGRAFGDSIGRKPEAELRELAASSRAKSTKLLRRGGFDLANIGWLITTHGAREVVGDWIHDHRKGWLLPRKGTRLPQMSIDAVESLRPAGEDLALRFPMYVTAAAMQVVLFGGDETAARLALIDAAHLAPMLVERQLVVAVIHHLIDLGVIVTDPGNRANGSR